jgi:hypothetical protein
VGLIKSIKQAWLHFGFIDCQTRTPQPLGDGIEAHMKVYNTPRYTIIPSYDEVVVSKVDTLYL